MLVNNDKRNSGKLRELRSRVGPKISRLQVRTLDHGAIGLSQLSKVKWQLSCYSPGTKIDETSASIVVEKFAFSYSVMIMSLHYRYRCNFHLKRLLEVSNYLLSDWLDTSRINFFKKLSRRDAIRRDPGGSWSRRDEEITGKIGSSESLQASLRQLLNSRWYRFRL